MAEYMADASSAGEKFSASSRTSPRSPGPILVITARSVRCQRDGRDEGRGRGVEEADQGVRQGDEGRRRRCRRPAEALARQHRGAARVQLGGGSPGWRSSARASRKVDPRPPARRRARRRSLRSTSSRMSSTSSRILRSRPGHRRQRRLRGTPSWNVRHPADRQGARADHRRAVLRQTTKSINEVPHRSRQERPRRPVLQNIAIGEAVALSRSCSSKKSRSSSFTEQWATSSSTHIRDGKLDSRAGDRRRSTAPQRSSACRRGQILDLALGELDKEPAGSPISRRQAREQQQESTDSAKETVAASPSSSEEWLTMADEVSETDPSRRRSTRSTRPSRAPSRPRPDRQDTVASLRRRQGRHRQGRRGDQGGRLDLTPDTRGAHGDARRSLEDRHRR